MFSRPSGLDSRGSGGSQREAFGAGFDDVGVEGEPVDDTGHQACIGYDLAPFGDPQRLL